MTKKILSAAEYVIIILCLNVLTFFLRPMTFTVFDIGLIYGGTDGLLDFISYLLIFMITVFIIGVFFKGENPLNTFAEFLGKFALRGLLPSLAVRLATDLIHFVLKTLPPLLLSISYSFTLIVEAASLYLTFWIIKRAVAPTKTKLHKSERIICICGGAVLLSLVGLYYYTVYKMLYVGEYISRKYADVGFSLTAAQNYEFKLQIINLVFSIVMWTTLLVYFGLFYSHIGRADEKYRVTTFFARVLSLFIIIPFAVGAKWVALPRGMMNCSVEQCFEPATDNWLIGMNYTQPMFTRNVSHSSDGGEFMYKSMNVYLYYGGQKILKFKRKDSSEIGRLYQITVPNVEQAFSFEFDAVAYVNNGVAFAIKTWDINNYAKEDSALISVLETLVSDGYFEAFEYSYKYLLKYDRDFIAPYISAYSAADLSDELSDKNDYIRPKYIRDFASGIAE